MKKDKTINIRLSEEEFQKIKKMANETNTNASDFVRKSCIEKIQEQERNLLETDLLIINTMSRIMWNLEAMQTDQNIFKLLENNNLNQSLIDVFYSESFKNMKKDILMLIDFTMLRNIDILSQEEKESIQSIFYNIMQKR